jgi:hypothetical protein
MRCGVPTASSDCCSARVSQRVVAVSSVFISANLAAVAGPVRSFRLKSRLRRSYRLGSSRQ